MGKNVVEVEQKLLKVVLVQFKVDVRHWLILHERYSCVARKPKCGSCIIEDLCEFKNKTDEKNTKKKQAQRVSLRYTHL